MDRRTTFLIALMMTTVSLAGCSGDDSGYEETISSLEQEALDDQAMMASLNATISSLTTSLDDLNAQITGLDTQIEELSLQNSSKASQIEILTLTVSSLEASKDLLEDQIAALETAKAELETQLEVRIFTAEDVDAYWDQGYEYGFQDGLALASPVSTLDTILERGYMKCGIKESQYGMGYLDWETGVRSGLDITYCRAVAAAIGLDPETDVEYISASGSDRFDKLATGTIDVLIRTTTWTIYRDAALDADYAGMNFYDGQGILVRSDAFAYGTGSADQLDDANICVAVGSTSEGNLQDWFSSREISFNSIGVFSSTESHEKLKDGTCDAYTGDASALVARKWMLDNDEDWKDSNDYSETWIATDQMSKEPLGAVTRDYDTEWNEIVKWVWFGMITAEESGVTSSNYATQANDACETNNAGSPTDPGICRLLTENFGLGTVENPLLSTWMQDVLSTAGNYGEAYDDAFCDGTYDGFSGSDAMTGCLISRAGSLNALVSEGGIQYAPAVR